MSKPCDRREGRGEEGGGRMGGLGVGRLMTHPPTDKPPKYRQVSLLRELTEQEAKSAEMKESPK